MLWKKISNNKYRYITYCNANESSKLLRCINAYVCTKCSSANAFGVCSEICIDTAMHVKRNARAFVLIETSDECIFL